MNKHTYDATLKNLEYAQFLMRVSTETMVQEIYLDASSRVIDASELLADAIVRLKQRGHTNEATIS